MPLSRRARRPTPALRRKPRYSPPTPTGGGDKKVSRRSRSRSRSMDRRPSSARGRGASRGPQGPGTPRTSAGHVPVSARGSSYPVPLQLSQQGPQARSSRPTTPLAVVPSRRQAEVAAARAAAAPRAPPKIYKSPQHFPSRDHTHFANENALHGNNIAGPPYASPIAAPAPPPPRGRARQRQGHRQGHGYHQRVAFHHTMPPQPRPRSRSPFGRFSLSPGKRRHPSKQNLTFSHENETFLFEPGSEFEESFYSTDNDGRTQLTRMLGGDAHLSQKVKAHIERKVDEEAAARFEKMSLKEKIHAQRMEAEAAMAAASRRNKNKKTSSAKNRSNGGKKKKSKRGKSRSYSSDEESQASLGELLEQACTGTGKRGKYYDEESTKYYSSESSSEEETEFTMGTMTLIEKAERLAKMKKKKKAKSKKKRHSSLPEGCKKVRCPPGRLGISIDTTAHGPAIGYIAPKSPLIGLVEVGDIIVTIDREDVTHLDAEDVMDMLSERKDEYRKLIIQM